jgi:hypothetical protein
MREQEKCRICIVASAAEGIGGLGKSDGLSN